MKMDKSKFAGTSRLKPNVKGLPSLGGIGAPAMKEEAEKKAPQEKKTEEKEAPKAEEKKETPKKAPEKPAEKPSAPAASVKKAPAEEEKRRRGRPQVRPLRLNEQGEKITNTNCPLTPEQNEYLVWLCQENDNKPKSAVLQMLVQQSYERNYQAFHEDRLRKSRRGVGPVL